MDEYRWKACSRQGQVYRGRLMADSLDEAGQILRQKYAYILQLRKLGPLEKPIRFSQALTLEEKAAFFHQLGLLLAGNIPILRALHMLGLGRYPAVCVLSRELERELSDGFSLSQALSRHSQVVDPMAAALTEAGEKSGRTVYILQQLAGFYQAQRALGKSLKQACLYPAIVSLLAFAMGIYFTGSILPVLMDMFQTMRVQPSPVLSGLLTLRSTLAARPVSAAAFLCLGSGALLVLARHKALVLQTLPFIRGQYREFWEIRYCQLLALLLDGGMLLDQALPAAGRILPTRKLRQAGKRVEQAVLMGHSLAQAAQEQPELFSSLMSEFIAIGEESGTLSQLLGEGAAIKETAFRERLERAKKLLEPALLLVLAIASAGMMYLMLSPMQQLMNGMTM